MSSSRPITIAAIAVLAFGAAWYFASPVLTLQGIRDAAQAKDTDKLASYVDFPALRTDVKADLSAAMKAEIKTDAGPLGALGEMIATAMLDKAVDGLVSPTGLSVMFATSNAASPDNGKVPSHFGGDDIDIQRTGLSEFKLVRKGQEGKGALVFHRDGLSWKLVGVDLPPGGLSKP